MDRIPAQRQPKLHEQTDIWRDTSTPPRRSIAFARRRSTKRSQRRSRQATRPLRCQIPTSTTPKAVAWNLLPSRGRVVLNADTGADASTPASFDEPPTSTAPCTTTGPEVTRCGAGAAIVTLDLLGVNRAAPLVYAVLTSVACGAPRERVVRQGAPLFANPCSFGYLRGVSYAGHTSKLGPVQAGR